MPCFAKRAIVKRTTETQTQTRVVHPRKTCLKKIASKDGDGEEEEEGESYYRRIKQDKNQKQRQLQKAFGAEALEHCRFGPDVIVDYMECTPVPLWNCIDPEVDFVAATAKDSAEIIPVSPKEGPPLPVKMEGGDVELQEVSSSKSLKELSAKSIIFQPMPQISPPMSWNPNLTELEEEEFAAEAALLPEQFKLAYCLPLENENEVYEKAIQVVQIRRADAELELRDRVRVILKETETEFHLRIEGRVIIDGTEDAELVKKRNKNYADVVQHHLVDPEAYVDRCTQTFLDDERDKYTQLRGEGVLDKTQLVNAYIMHDDYIDLKEKKRLQKLKQDEEAIMKALADQTQEGFSENKYRASDEEDSDEEEEQQVESKVDWSKVDDYFDLDEDLEVPPDDMNDLDEELEVPSDEELDVKVQIDVLYANRVEKALKSRPKLLPDISFSVLILERISSTIKYQKKHMDIRGLEPIFKKELTRRQMYQLRNDALVDAGPTLKRYWSYKPNITKGLEVTSMSVHPTNGNIVAVSYGGIGYPLAGVPLEGLVCLWNLKNINFPERVYRFDVSATVVVFSNLTPYLLAIGLMDGNIFVYDVRSNEPKAFCSTEKMIEKPFGPIWDLFWLIETEMASTGLVKEVLISVSDDGYLHRWTSSKGFEPWVILKVRRSPLKIPGRREKRAEALISQWSATYTVCFYPEDLTMYLIGTEEGFIHKCTTSYTEQFVGTFVSHTGPIYAIRFSPFSKDIFMSCGGDWCVKIWKEDFPTAPLLSISTGLRTIFDVAWAPNMSSVFVCTNELQMEVWDITINTLEPIIQFKYPNLGLRRVSFYDYVHGLIVGDDDGGVTVYAVRNFQEQPQTMDDQIDHLLEGLVPGYKRKMSEEAEPTQPAPAPPIDDFFGDEDEDEEEGDEDEEEEEEGDEYEYAYGENGENRGSQD